VARPDACTSTRNDDRGATYTRRGGASPVPPCRCCRQSLRALEIAIPGATRAHIAPDACNNAPDRLYVADHGEREKRRHSSGSRPPARRAAVELSQLVLRAFERTFALW